MSFHTPPAGPPPVPRPPFPPQTALLGIEAVLGKLRVERSETESDLAGVRSKAAGLQVWRYSAVQCGSVRYSARA